MAKKKKGDLGCNLGGGSQSPQGTLNTAGILAHPGSWDHWWVKCNICLKKIGSCASRNRVKGQRQALTHPESWDHWDYSTQESSWAGEVTEILGQGSFPAFILSQETELRPRPLRTFPARAESTSREGSDPRNQEVDLSSRFCATSLQEERLHAEVLWPLGLRKELESQECWQRLKKHRRNKLQPETARTSNTRDYQIVKAKWKNLTNR